jgi:hypothetical protein
MKKKMWDQFFAPLRTIYRVNSPRIHSKITPIGTKIGINTINIYTSCRAKRRIISNEQRQKSNKPS